ncbi:hypothetical protein FNV33_02845 [Dolosigranulum pigrum]|uniref:Uncharacterized protein n=2 Tax=Dolosigranulum pigrum TaxID=29394 RepID=A0A516GHR9_9LACT|nr:hypothetical protein FNV33_02845 [Dolosigranulum pigrum]
MDDETAKSNKRYYCSIINITPEQQDQLSQAIDKATNNKEIAQILQQSRSTSGRELQTRCESRNNSKQLMTPSKLKKWQSRKVT